MTMAQAFFSILNVYDYRGFHVPPLGKGTDRPTSPAAPAGKNGLQDTREL
jgi:hypothetical protein